MSYSFQKEAILNILRASENHQSVDELHKKLTEIIPKVSLMTVYRNLNKLVKEGIAFPFHNHLDSEGFLPLLNGIIVKGFCNNCRVEK